MNIYLSRILKIKNLFFIASCLFIFGPLTPTHAQNGAFNTFYWVTTGDDEAFKANRKINFPIQGAIGLKSRYETNNLSASLSFSFNKNQEISSDNSYLDFKIKNGVRLTSMSKSCIDSRIHFVNFFSSIQFIYSNHSFTEVSLCC